MKLISYFLLVLNLFQISPKLKTTKAFNKDDLYLGDMNEVDLNNYYGDYSNKRKDELISYLYSRISLNNTFVSYSSINDWYKITDRNWSISSSISDTSTYDFSNDNGNTYYLNNMYFSSSSNNNPSKAISTEVNKIKKYDESKGVTYIYDSNSKLLETSSKPNNNIQVDKEHVWAKNHGFKVKDSKGDDILNKGAPTDLHNLVAADHNTNSSGHSDYYYGNVINKNSSTEVYSYLADGSKEVSGWKELIGLEYVFEPRDEWKGNVARCLFYMATRYSKKLDKNTQEEPYLVLSNSLDNLEDNNEIFHGVHLNLDTMLKWHELDPVDEYEKHRNNLIYYNVQNNRNPYIDFPSLVKRAFSNEYDFSQLKDNYYFHIGNEYNLNIVLPQDDSEFVLEEVVYDSNIFNLVNNIKVVPIKEGTSDLVFKITNKNTDEILTYKTTINVKDKLIYEGETLLDLSSFEKFEFNYKVNNLFENEEVSLSNYSNLISIENNVIKAGLIGNTSIDVIVNSSDDDTTIIQKVDVKVRLSVLVIIIISLVGLIVLTIIVVLIILASKKKKTS